MLPISLDYPFFIITSVFSSVYSISTNIHFYNSSYKFSIKVGHKLRDLQPFTTVITNQQFILLEKSTIVIKLAPSLPLIGMLNNWKQVGY